MKSKLFKYIFPSLLFFSNWIGARIWICSISYQ